MAGMRKLLLLAGALAITLPLAACGGDKKPNAADQTATTFAVGLDTDRPLSDQQSGGGTPASADFAGTASATAASGTPGTTVAGSPAAVGTNAPGATPASTSAPSTSAPSTPGSAQPSATPATSAPGSTVAAPTATPATSGSPAASATVVPSSSAALQLTSASGNRNQEVEVVLSASATAGNTLRGWIIDVEYDPAFAEAGACTVEGFAVCNQKYRPQLVRFVGTADAVTEIGRAKFKLIGPAGGSSGLRIIATECIGASGEAVSCSGSEATLRIN